MSSSAHETGAAADSALELRNYLMRSAAHAQRSARASTIIAVVVWAGAAAWLGYVVKRVSDLDARQQALQARHAELVRDSARLAAQLLTMRLQRDTLLAAQGWAPERLAGPVQTSEVHLAAHATAVAREIAAGADADDRAGITVQIFSRDVDRRAVHSALRALGFQVQPRRSNPAIPADKPSNALWCTSDVPVADVKLVLLTLLRAGVGIDRIQPIVHAARSGTIQVGSSLKPPGRKGPYTAAEIESARAFPCGQGAQP